MQTRCYELSNEAHQLFSGAPRALLTQKFGSRIIKVGSNSSGYCSEKDGSYSTSFDLKLW